MSNDGHNLGKLTFPGRAGELQRGGETIELIRELGDNYAVYNRFLAEEARRLGGDPDPADYRRDQYDEYLRDVDRARDIVAAEMLLRRARGRRVEGKPLNAARDLETPLLDADQRIVSIETGRPTIDHPARRRPRARVPNVAPE